MLWRGMAAIVVFLVMVVLVVTRILCRLPTEVPEQDVLSNLTEAIHQKLCS